MAKSETSLIFSTSQCAIVLNITDRQVRRLCDSGKLIGAVQSGGGGRWKIPATAHPALEAIQRGQQVCPADCSREVQPGELVEVLLMLKKVADRINKLIDRGISEQKRKGKNNVQKET